MDKINMKKLFTVILSVMLIFCMAFTFACDKGGNNNSGSSSSSSSTSATDQKVTQTDTQAVKNGDFQFGTDEKSSYPKYTGINWTRSVAGKSSRTSGVIDTEDSAYNKLADENKPVLTEANGENEATYFNPRTPEYYGLVKAEDKFVFNAESYEDGDNEDGLVTSGSKILMIHNETTAEAGRGAAIKFTSSSSLTTSTGYAKLTVWVLTKDLKTIQGDTQEFGAYISVASTLSLSQPPLMVKNINTNGVWAEYTIYIEASDIANSRYTVTLGLGMGTANYKAEYVEGFAYFDNVHFEEIEEAEYVANTVYNIYDEDANGERYTELVANQTGKTYAANGDASQEFSQANYDATTKVNVSYSHRIAKSPLTVAVKEQSYNEVFVHSNTHNTGATAGVDTLENVSGTISGLSDAPVAQTENALYINLSELSSYTVTSDKIEVAANAYAHYSFFAHVETGINQKGATIIVEEVDASGNVLGSEIAVAQNFNTYNAEDKAHEWQKVSLFVENEYSTVRYFRIKFTLGTTDKVFEQAVTGLTKGHAVFAGFTTRALTEEQFNASASVDDHSATIALGREFVNGPEADDTQAQATYTFNTTSSTNALIQTQLVSNISGYTGIVGGHTMVGGEQSSYKHQDNLAGILNTKYLTSTFTYGLNADTIAAIKALKGEADIQPIVIQNTTAQAYGFVGSQLTLAANTTALISVNVKVVGDANAYVYLVNAEPLGQFTTLSVAEKQLAVKVTKDSKSAKTDSWVTVNFVVTTGEDDVIYRVELWNGERSGSAPSTGSVIFDGLKVTTSPNVNTLLAQLHADFDINADNTTTAKHKRADTVVKYTNSDGAEATYTITYDEQVVFTSYDVASTIVATYETTHTTNEIDNTASTETPDEGETEEPEQGSRNWTLQITSIVIAVVLLAVLVVVVVRLVVKKNKKVQVSQQNNFDRSGREAAQARIKANRERREAAAKQAALEAQKRAEEAQAKAQEEEKVEKVEEAEEVAHEAEAEQAEEQKEYDYDNPENNV